jgi:hypothetical protein
METGQIFHRCAETGAPSRAVSARAVSKAKKQPLI